MKNKEYDIFTNYSIYPNAENIFSTALHTIEKCKDKCIYVLDTNALLVPYATGSQSLSEIKKIFEKLKKQKRIIVPGQVAREFANNRPEKLKEIFQKLNRQRNNIQNVALGKYPLLDEIQGYKEALEFEVQINELINKYRKSISKVIDTVKNWAWNDPVSLIYRQVFTADTILDIPIDREKVKSDLEYRYQHKIPPGFKDENKPDDGIGDLLIWLTILEIAKSKKDVIFVSGEEKSDWYHRSENQGLYPRFELVNEFRLHSDNKTFHIIKLSELLILLGADEKAVSEIAREEKTIPVTHADFMSFSRRSKDSVFEWLLETTSSEIKRNEVGFPDFIVNHDNGTNAGVEVISLFNHNIARMQGMKIREKLMRAYYEVKENNLTSFQFFFVASASDYPFEEMVEGIDIAKRNFNESSIEIQYVYGFLDEGNKFVRIK